MTKKLSFDFEEIAEDFRRLGVTDVGSWALIPKVTILLSILLGVMLLAWLLFWSEQLETLETKRQEEEKLKQEFVSKKEQAINLDAYVQQLNDVDRSFGALLKQLPNKAEMESLLVDVNQAGLGRGLQFELFRPGAEVIHDFYAEMPVSVRLLGSYHDLGAFSADIAKLPRIVTLNNLSIQQQGAVTNLATAPLAMEMTIKTFRYLDEEELKAVQAPPKKPGEK